ncbi:MAG: hypothetical protein KBD01_11065 [Acidobacteria bacterium]|nr:hypothetical protein [Acidobacteriota bacterium]
MPDTPSLLAVLLGHAPVLGRGPLATIAVEAAEILLLVFVMMVAVDLLDVWLRGKLARFVGGSVVTECLAGAVLGAVPGCSGVFLSVTLYAHGAFGFGGLVAAMVATTGDDAFVILSLLVERGMWGSAAALFGTVIGLGFAGGVLAHHVAARRGAGAYRCPVPSFHPGFESVGHFLREHVGHHILRKHMPRLALWTIGALVLVKLFEQYEPQLRSAHPSPAVALAAALGVSLLPTSGPHQVFATFYVNGLVPFAALLANSVAQNGHGLLPLLSVSWRDAVRVKVATLLLGLVAGIAALLLA